MAIVILLQSLAAVADAHQFHQASDQHLIIAEQLDERTTLDAVDSSGQKIKAQQVSGQQLATQQNDSINCQHCCHCHGTASLILTTATDAIWLVKSQPLRSTYLAKYASETHGSLYRPPIV